MVVNKIFRVLCLCYDIEQFQTCSGTDISLSSEVKAQRVLLCRQGSLSVAFPVLITPPLHDGGYADSLSFVYPNLESLDSFSLDALNSELQWSIIAVSHSVSLQFFHIPDPEDEKKDSNTISNMPRAISRRVQPYQIDVEILPQNLTCCSLSISPHLSTD